MSHPETATKSSVDKAEITVDPITHIDLRGHSRQQLGDVIDLSQKPEGFSEKWSHDYWEGEAKRWARAEALEKRLNELDPEGAQEGLFTNFKADSPCGECGNRVYFERVGSTLVAKSECDMPGGIPPYDVLLNVPSGRIVMANDLREMTMVEGSFNVNTTKGQMDLTRAYAEDGMAHIFTGNTCPGVYEQSEGYAVALDNNSDATASDPGPKRGSICTDLWWYSAMDKDLFEARCAEQSIDPTGLIEVELEVEPGVYAFSDELADRDADGFVVLSRIRKVDAVTPTLRARKTDYAGNLLDSHFWKEVTRLSKMKPIFPNKDYILADMFTVLGNGYDWYSGCIRNVSGHSEDTPFRKKLKPVAAPRNADYVPAFANLEIGTRREAGLYPTPMSHSTLGQAPLDADPYWLAAGMMFLKTVLTGDVKAMTHSDQSPEQIAKQNADLREVLVASLDVLCEIAAKRKIDKDGTLDRIFGEIQQAWA